MIYTVTVSWLYRIRYILQLSIVILLRYITDPFRNSYHGIFRSFGLRRIPP